MKKILVVDDNKEIAELIKDKLIMNNYEVSTATSGQNALELCKALKPDLILLDIAMPVMDGYQTAKELREISEIDDTPILFLTGKDLEETSIIAHCKSLKNCGYVPKLFTLKELLEKIKEVVG
ncbi:MAG: response regulator [Candidatus Omnitrophica bacterium]|nr:response regulator [Candidatus Omnitrophota bacterium]